MNDIVLQISGTGTLLEFRGRADNDLFVSSENITGKNIVDVIPSNIAQPFLYCVEKALETGELQHCEYPCLKSGRHYEAKFIVTGVDRVLVLVSDISDHKKTAEKATYLAYHDPLTNLPNRSLFHDRLKQSMERAEREGQLLSVLFLDLDNFKHINDTIGHRAGDQLLKGVADRLVKGVRKTDSISRVSPEEPESMVARLGGDEFTILLTDVKHIQDPAKVSQRIFSLLSEPFMIGSNEVFITASIGIAVYPHDGSDVDNLLMNADLAMYQAKNQGRNNYQYYSDSLNAFAFERFTIEHKLRKALDHNEFMLFYQPQIDITTGNLIGVEALIRWLQPDLVLVKPGDFIPLAEETGLIIPIGEWVLRTACSQNRAWQKAGLKPIRMTVNVSSIQFMQNNFLDTVSRILNDTGLAPHFLQLELTETTLMRDSENSIKKLHALQAMGIQIALDDFGTGYSSLNYLKRFPLTTVKIDNSFVQDLNTSLVDQSIVNAIVHLAHNFHLTVIAEGVEKSNQLDFLRRCGCEGVQGFLICPPVNAGVLTQFMKKEKHLDILKTYAIKR